MCVREDEETSALRQSTFKLSVIGLPGWPVLVVTRRDVTSERTASESHAAREFRERSDGNSSGDGHASIAMVVLLVVVVLVPEGGLPSSK